MASPQSIAEGSDVVTSDQLNYQQKLFSHPSYQLTPQFPNTFGQTISLGAGQSPVTINVPPEVFNLSESYLSFTVQLPLVALNYIWTFADTLSEIAHIQFYPGSNNYLVDIDNLQNYQKIVMKKECSIADFTSLDQLNRFVPSNSLVNVVPALRNGRGAAGAAQAQPSAQNFTEPAYFNVSALAAPATYNVLFPLRLIKNSIFSINKNLYFGQLMYMKLFFGPISKVAYMSTSNAAPSLGTPTAYTGAATIANLQLLLAVESNQNVRQSIIDKVERSGLNMIIPYVQAYKNSNSGSTQNISIQFDVGNGRSLQKVIHSVFNNIESLDTAYDCANNAANLAPSATAPGYSITNPNFQKAQTFYTQLNGRRLQLINLDSTSATGAFTDYLQNKRLLRGSVMENLNVYQYNWFHCDDFSEYGAHYDQNNDNELISGIPMGAMPLTWSFVGLVMAQNGSGAGPPAYDNVTFQHYTYAVFSKKLSITPQLVTVV